VFVPIRFNRINSTSRCLVESHSTVDSILSFTFDDIHQCFHPTSLFFS